MYSTGRADLSLISVQRTFQLSGTVAIVPFRHALRTEVGDCANCWRAIATRAVFYAAAYMSLYHGEDEAIADIQRQLAGTIDDADQP